MYTGRPSRARNTFRMVDDFSSGENTAPEKKENKRGNRKKQETGVAVKLHRCVCSALSLFLLPATAKSGGKFERRKETFLPVRLHISRLNREKEKGE